MFLEIHDNETGNSLMGTAYSLDYEYQAEMHVMETCEDHSSAVRWALFTNSGSALRVWERNGKEPKEVFPATMPSADPRSIAGAKKREDMV